MIVIVAEKPSVGRDIAHVLGCSQSGEGCIRGDKYTVTWALGHLVTLCEPDEIDEKYKKWRMDDLPMLPDELPTKIIAKTRKQFTVVKKLINDKDTERVICATDAGREGELIFYYIYTQAKCQKPVDRLWISSMTDEAIREGFDQLKPDIEYEGLRKSAVCRSEADWLVGMNASRAFTLRYNALLSIGRVQTPTLNILVKRRKEIEDFKPVEYYTLTADFGDYTGLWFDEKAEDKTAQRISSKERAEELASKVKGKPARVRSVTSEEKRELPPQLYDLTSLQRDANRMLGFTAEKTLKIAQSLYEKWKLLTYPRTDSRYLPMDMLPKLYQTLKVLPEPYRSMEAGMARKEDGKLYVSKRIFDNAKVSDHHALLPTPKTADLSKLPQDERSLYDLVARRMLAAFYPAYEYDAVRVITDCEGEAFRSTGRAVKQEGWKALYQQQPEEQPKKGRGKKKSDEDEEDIAQLPALQAGEDRTVKKTSVQQCATKPPAPHTDASLLAAMEHAGREIEDEELRESMKGAGLGTPATRAAIIERLLQVGYAARRGRTINATDKGVRLIDVVPDEIASPEMTGRWEKALDEIAKNQGDTDRFMQGIRRMSAFLVEFARDGAPKADFPEEQRRGSKSASHSGVKPLTDAVCPLCGKPVQETAKAFGCSGWKEGCKFTLWKDGLTRGGGPALNAKIVQLLLKNGTVKGSTGTLSISGEQLSFTANGQSVPGISVNVRYEKKTAGK
ncbi:MAG: DNA topoisomerase III [Clostridia bacterium]|nr:DNA topoisomerase III [Clostridia bacterium]